MVHLERQFFKNQILLVLRVEYSGRNVPIPWLLMTLLLLSPEHKQLGFEKSTINTFLSSVRKWKYIYIRTDSRFVPSQWETSLQSNAVSYWLGANLESALYLVFGNFSPAPPLVKVTPVCQLLFTDKQWCAKGPCGITSDDQSSSLGRHCPPISHIRSPVTAIKLGPNWTGQQVPI